MKKNNHKNDLLTKLILLLFLAPVCTCPLSAANSADPDYDYPDFFQALKSPDDDRELAIGDILYEQLEQKYRNDTGFTTLNSKLAAAKFLADRMVGYIQKAKSERINSILSEMTNKSKSLPPSNPSALPPARNFYSSAKKLFTKPVKISGLNDTEKRFLKKYYNIKLRQFTTAIGKAGQALTVADPAFQDTHHYILVLPLLHASETKPVDANTFPLWMQKPEQIARLADSCLVHFGIPFQAMTLAKSLARMKNKTFSEIDFYKSAALKVRNKKPHIAVKSLKKALDYIPENNTADLISLHYKIVQTWIDAGNYDFAASAARKIFNTFPEHKKTGKALWLYFYALSRAGKNDVILSKITGAIDDKRCKKYQPRLMYIKWWALRRKRDQSAKVAAIEYKILNEYGDNPIVAPILLSKATNLLAAQKYNAAQHILKQLWEKFPSTRTAHQAEKMLEKLRTAHRP